MNKFVLNFKKWLYNNKIYESFSYDEESNTKNILIYTLSKDTNYEMYFKQKNLKFANNAGNMYGLGIYGGLEMPNENDMVYKDEARKKLYGSNIYEFSIPSERLFYFYYEYFEESSLFEILDKPSRNDFIIKQLSYFGIKMPSSDILKSITPDNFDYEKAQNDTKSNGNQGQCAFNFYKYMNSIYYQRRDGTLDSPVAGIVYLGKMDGRVGVIWNAYELTLNRKCINGKWIDVDMPAQETEDTVEDANEEDEIFDGNQTDEKEEIYRKLVAYKGEKTPLGQFVDIDIHDDKTIDATFKSNVPEMDGGRHTFLMAKTKYIDYIIDKGYSFNKLDCWIKFGNSPKSSPEQLWLPSDVDVNYLPKQITKGVIITSVSSNLKDEIKALNDLDFKSNNKLVLNNCYVNSLDFSNWEVIEMNSCIVSDNIYESLKNRKDINMRGKHDSMTTMSESMENELIEYVKKNRIMPKEEKEKFAEKFNMSLKDFEKAYSNSNAVKQARKK